MARLRKFSAYRRLERPYTRISRLRKKSFIRASPRVNIIRFTMGDASKKFSCQLNLRTKEALQIRHNAIESARMTCNRLLETKLGKNGYHLKIRIYPFHVLRENPLAAGAGADRMSTGMQKSYGKPISNAARLKAGQVIFSLDVNKTDLKTARLALKRASYKLPCGCRISLTENQ
jgi:large subunit ribosomal protein L10e